ncbi:MAG: Crp/Fnr family transcriptional regulator, partial [Chitinophagaceae bacterium]
DGFAQFLEDVNAVAGGRSASAVLDAASFRRKQNIYSEGRKPRYLFYIASGKVKTTRSHEDGKEYITDISGPGDFIGYTSLIEDSSYTETATILEDAEIIQVPKEHFLKLLYNDPGISAKFVHLIARNVKEKEERLLGLAYSSLRKRIAAALVDIAGKFSHGNNTAILEISREEIAQYVGTATESLIRTLADFKEEGLIRIEKGKVIISHQERLAGLLR